MKIAWLLLIISCLVLIGCGKSGEDSEGDTIPITIQTDWFPQPEHGGFYQALAKGYYREVGLDVTIQPGGPNSMTTQQVLRGRAHFAMNRADTIYGLAQRNIPLVMVMATLQHDPQAILLHASNPIENFQQLDRQRVMAIPGLMWIRWLEMKYGIELSIIPHDFGMERFINNPLFIQQCLLTNEPFYAQANGIDVRVLPLRESGFDPYHAIYALQDWAAANPGIVSRFVAASIRGWQDFIFGDPSPAFELIGQLNPKMTPDFMRFSHATMREYQLVQGIGGTKDSVGQLNPDRIQAMIAEMVALGLAEPSEDQSWYSTRFLPEVE